MVNYRCAECPFKTSTENAAKAHHNSITGHVIEFYRVSSGKWEKAFVDQL